MRTAAEGDLVQLISQDGKRFLITLRSGERFSSHRGVIDHDTLIGQPLGRVVKTHQGYPFLVLEPTLHDLLQATRRRTQIMFPKDIGYLLLKLYLFPGARVIEAGTGSGALTTALAWWVRPNGRVYSYEVRPDMLELARKNLTKLGLAPFVEFKRHDIADGFDEQDVDALFLDVRTPWEYLAQAHAALRGGGTFGAIVPTTNQVDTLITALPQYGFGSIEVEEILLRTYKAIPGRLRPQDRMIGHTGYLIFARRIEGTLEIDWYLPRKGREKARAALQDLLEEDEP